LLIGFLASLVFWLKSKRALGILGLILLAFGFLVFGFLKQPIANYFIFHGASTFLHLESYLESLRLIKQYPFGLGLGITGPALNKISPGGFMSESWYFQLILELGFLGLAIFGGILVTLARYLLKIYNQNQENLLKALAAGLFLALVAISGCALFLHTWADTATAYPFWLLVGSLLTLAQNQIINHSSKKEGV
jgi:Na+-transporting NADH:ubiquinone oxidoreductase subunit NqrE